MTAKTDARSDEATSEPEPGRAERPQIWRRPLVLEAVGTAVLAQALFFLGLGGGLDRLRVPLGRGDMLAAYAMANTFAQGSFRNDALGYPFGMDMRYFPTTDHLLNAVAGFVSAMTHEPFLGLNVVYALSFPATALAALWMLRIAGLRGPMAVVLSLAMTFIPFHWLRIEHVYLATLFSAVLGVCLALLVGTGEIERRLTAPRRARYVIGLGLVALVIAVSGIYYAAFAVMLVAVAVLWRFAHGARWRDLLLAATPAIAVGLFTVLALAPATLYTHAHPPTQPVAGRVPVESVIYSGALALALLPAPLSKIPGFGLVNDFVTRAYQDGSAAPTSGVVLQSNSGSLFTCAAFVFMLVGIVWTARRRAQGKPLLGNETGVTFGLVGTLTVVVVGFLVPWGLNFLFAFAVSPQLRAWDRLLPVLYSLFFVGAAVAWRRLGLPQTGMRVWLAAGACGVLLLLDGIAPYRTMWGQIVAAGTAEQRAAQEYAAAVDEAVPGRCGILQLPLIQYPEVPPQQQMGPYDHLLPALVGSGKEWSFGAMKGTSASDWQESMGSGGFDPSLIPVLDEGGFCAVHVDRRGYTADQYASLTRDLRSALGAPVASGHNGDWTLYAIPGSTADQAPLDDRLSELSPEARRFYAPLTPQG